MFIIILDKNGKRLPIDNKKNYPTNAYYYPQVPDIIKAMKAALIVFEEIKNESLDESQDITNYKNDEKNSENLNIEVIIKNIFI